MPKMCRPVVLVAAATLLLAAQLGAQSNTGNLFGSVIDAQGAPVAGAEVALAGPAARVERPAGPAVGALQLQVHERGEIVHVQDVADLPSFAAEPDVGQRPAEDVREHPVREHALLGVSHVAMGWTVTTHLEYRSSLPAILRLKNFIAPPALFLLAGLPSLESYPLTFHHFHTSTSCPRA